MSVSAFTDAYGGPYYAKEDTIISQNTVKVNGSVVVNRKIVNQSKNGSIRGPHTSNPPVALTPDGPKVWRRPSTYERSAFNLDFEPGRWRFELSNSADDYYVIKGPPNLVESWRMFRVRPMYSSSMMRPLWDSNATNEVQTKVLRRLRDQKVEVGTNLAEAKRTANMFADVATSLLGSYKALRRGNIAGLKRHLLSYIKDRPVGSLPSNWYLQYKYGWKPLINEVYGAWSLLNEELQRPLLISADATVNDYGREDYNVLEPGYVTFGEAQRTHVCSIHARISDDFLQTASRAGIGFADPLSVAWEVVPFSFVIDWGIPVGAVLEALAAPAGLTFVGGFDALRVEGHASARLLPPSGWEEDIPRGANAEFFYSKRVPLSGFPRPLLYAKSPFSSGNVLSALALARQRN